MHMNTYMGKLTLVCILFITFHGVYFQDCCSSICRWTHAEQMFLSGLAVFNIFTSWVWFVWLGFFDLLRWKRPDQAEKEDGASESYNSKNPKSQEEIRHTGLWPGNIWWDPPPSLMHNSLFLEALFSVWTYVLLQTLNLKRLSDSLPRNSLVVPRLQQRMK